MPETQPTAETSLRVEPLARWVFKGSGDLPRCSRDRAVATAECREPASSDRLPVHRSESPTGYSSAGCSPAEPASASPVTDNSSSISIPRGNQMHGPTSPALMQFRPLPAFGWGARARVRRQRGVSSLLCAPGVISILRRQHRGRATGASEPCRPESLEFRLYPRRTSLPDPQAG